MESVFEFLFMTEWGQYIVGGFGVSGFVSHAVAITPTKKDDQALGIIRTVLNIVGGNYANARNEK